MSNEEKVNNQLIDLSKEEDDIHDKVLDYQRQLMTPLWNKRREIVKQIPNFWSEAISNSPLFDGHSNENDIEAIENLKDFHVEYDDKRPKYRKIVAHFNKNDVFKNENLTKEFTVDEEDGAVLSKTKVEYHSGKEPTDKKKRKAADMDDDDDFDFNFIQWFADDSIPVGAMLSEDIFPRALEYYKGTDESDDDLEEEIELGSDSEEDDEEDEEDEPKAKKSKK
ncbi:hypothetical protein DM01DRAFT_1409711 [Hesseltinella vesiculosa]|uniref:NAP-domain-containing protein n=1 Tax=Hesseltinella vesiculosa TaxID=101127 RepID=A0A1X2GA22_9FUNG|nr:hypothetical protein DM01DRAFT_1409711 [Hesseltinella vesiculosa]